MNATLPQLDRERKGRFTHIIRKNHRGAMPAARVYVDTEALIECLSPTVQRQTLWFGWACFERVQKLRTKDGTYTHWVYFETAADFFTELEAFTREHSTTYIYAHNLQYDAALLSLATMAEQHAWKITEYVPASHLLWITLAKGSKHLQFVDTLNYFQTSLKALGESIGEYKTHLESNPEPHNVWSNYCRQDVQVLVTAMHHLFALIREQDLGNYRKTAASIAYGAWRHRFMHHDVLVINDDKLEALEREAYHGGRSEVFYDLPLEQAIHALDINSMYPWVMRDNLFPCRKLAKGHALSIESLQKRIQHEGFIAKVRLHTDKPCYPLAVAGRVVYPTGDFETTLSTPELQFALQHGDIRSVGQWASYDMQPLFTEYVTTLYALRLQYRETGNEAFAYLCKLLLNSLYGKFGQRGYQWKPCPWFEPDDTLDWLGSCEADGPVLRHKQRFGQVWHQEVNEEAFESFPAIAAHVTAYARMALWNLIARAGRQHVYYTDTDSLYVDDQGLAALEGELDPTELGKLKRIGSYAWAHFKAAKDYATPTEVKVKGVRKSAWKVSETVYEQPQFESYDQALSRGCDGEIRVTFRQKRLKRRNLQSVGEGVGWRVPLHYGA